MITKFFRKLAGVDQLESQMEFIFSLQIAMLRRYDIKEDEIAKLVKDEAFISELYAAKLIKLVKE